MPMDYSDEVIQQAIDRVRAGETAKDVSRDLRIPPKYIREWVAADKVVRKVRKFLDSLTPEQFEALNARLEAEFGVLGEEDFELPKTTRERKAT